MVIETYVRPASFSVKCVRRRVDRKLARKVLDKSWLPPSALSCAGKISSAQGSPSD